ncbi:efflux RND transporter periplasmic adaptor subunit [Deinococcus lacus]|uniref:Efflux RND transporter periplasmic adaptor subunit n=1 Tax=Deinococcus lacus TaxID=392561 RepID=A0ABW1YB61_9DEIO
MLRRGGQLRVERTATATLEAGRVSDVAAQASGVVREWQVPEGGRVTTGQVVAVLDDTDYRQALQNAELQAQQARVSLEQTGSSTASAAASLQASVSAAQAGLSRARQDLSGAEAVYAAGGLSLSEVQAARERVAQAESQLAQAQNQLTQNGRGQQGNLELLRAQLRTAEAGVVQAREKLAQTEVKAPFAGIVSEHLVQVGESAGQGSPVFRLVDPASLRASFRVPPADAAELPSGQALNLSYGGQNYVATVLPGERVAGKDRLVPVRARVEGGVDLPLGAGAQVRYRVNLGNGTLIPSRALQVDGGENSVFVAEGNVARRLPVSVVAEAGGDVAVEGISPGAALIYPVPNSLQDGARVSVTPAAGETP